MLERVRRSRSSWPSQSCALSSGMNGLLLDDEGPPLAEAAEGNTADEVAAAAAARLLAESACGDAFTAGSTLKLKLVALALLEIADEVTLFGSSRSAGLGRAVTAPCKESAVGVGAGGMEAGATRLVAVASGPAGSITRMLFTGVGAGATAGADVEVVALATTVTEDEAADENGSAAAGVAQVFSLPDFGGNSGSGGPLVDGTLASKGPRATTAEYC